MEKNKEDKNKILIVDDEPINIRQMGEFLKPLYELAVATGGMQALKIANLDPQPDLILLDVVMPGVDGHEVCQALKNNHETQHIPVIFLTANDKEEDEAKGLELGAVDYIKKPFRPLVDLQRIKTHIFLHQDKKQEIKQLVESLPWATLIVDNGLMIKSMNSLAQQLLSEQGSDFINQNNKLVYTKQASLLTSLIQVENNSEKLKIIKSFEQSYRIFSSVLSSQNMLSKSLASDDAQNHIIYISRYTDVLYMEEQLRQMYDLTAAEARLTNGILNGLTLEEIADQNSLKYSTLKSYLKIIFQKTGTKKQHELVSVILRNFTC